MEFHWRGTWCNSLSKASVALGQILINVLKQIVELGFSHSEILIKLHFIVVKFLVDSPQFTL